MNQESRNETEAIRSEIDDTRRRMDETMGALGDRLQGRHLLDEILGFFRQRRGSADAAADKIKHSAETALHSVVDTVRAHPLPTLAVGASLGWLIYASRKRRSRDQWDSGGPEFADYDERRALSGDVRYDPDVHYDRPLEYPTGEAGAAGGLREKASEKLEHAKDTVAQKTSAAKEKLGHVGQQAREKMHALRERADELGSRARERGREAYSRSRERVIDTAEQHPLELGLGCLAAGVLIGLLLPTPEPVNRAAGARLDRLRDRAREAGRDAVEKGKRVAQAATQAAQEEAETQGLTLDRLRDKAGAVAERAAETASETARDEGLAPGGERQREGGNLSGSTPGNPSAARPAI